MQEQLVNFQNLIAVDPGDLISGFCVIENGKISFGENYHNLLVFPKIRELLEIRPYMVIIEDVRAYGTRLSPQLLLTAKFIGELEYCLNQAGIAFKLVPRYEVKMWVYNTFPKIVLPRVAARVALEDRRRLKMDLKRLRTKAGDLYKGNFIWVDDRIIKAAMAHHWEIKKPKPGKPTPFGLKDHSWQALGLASMILSRSI